MISGLESKLLPYLSHLLYGQLVLVCFAILAGAGLIIYRIISNQPLEGDAAYTKEKIAYELSVEIQRLRDLRDRIFPGYENKTGAAVTHDAHLTPAAHGHSAAAAAAEASATAHGAPAESSAAAPNADGTVSGAAPAAEGAKPDGELEKKFRDQIAELEAKNKELQTKLAAAATATAAPASSLAATLTADAVAQVTQEKELIQKDQMVLKNKVEVLEKTLMEYQIFESDIALVKKYKSENEELRKQLSATPQVTEEDIASLFNAISVPEKNAAPDAADAAAGVPSTPAVEVASAVSAPEPSPQMNVTESLARHDQVPPETSIDVSVDKLLEDLAAGAAPGGGFEVDALAKTAEPSVNVTVEDLEAMAESDSQSDDKIVAEFQKILGENKP